LPSEKVYYFFITKPSDQGPRPAPLLEWIYSQLELVEELSARSADRESAPTDLQPRRLTPSSRYVLQGLLWRRVADIRTPSIFGSAIEDIKNEFAIQFPRSRADDQEFNLEISNECELKVTHHPSRAQGRKLVPQTD
jgi:hypothetical protein